MQPAIDVITLEVADLARAKTFFVDGLNGQVAEDQRDVVRVEFDGDASTFELRPSKALGDGFRGFTLSYIVDSAAAVDGVLARTLRSGGTIAKPPQRAIWGYSAYVADPSGHLWKLASPKRKPLLARDGDADETATAAEIVVTLGVEDVKRAKRLYADEHGWPVKQSYSKFVRLDGGDGASDLAFYRWDDLAADAGVSPAGGGFRGLILDGFESNVVARPVVQA